MVLDLSVQSLALAIDDFICGRSVPKSVTDGVEHVDFNVYLARLQEAMKEVRAAGEEPTEASSIAQPTESETIIFGGMEGAV